MRLVVRNRKKSEEKRKNTMRKDLEEMGSNKEDVKNGMIWKREISTMNCNLFMFKEKHKEEVYPIVDYL